MPGFITIDHKPITIDHNAAPQYHPNPSLPISRGSWQPWYAPWRAHGRYPALGLPRRCI